MKVAIIGGGGWGTALALQIRRNHRVTIWSYDQGEAALFNEKRENVYYLPGVKLPDDIVFTTEDAVVDDADIVLFVTPSKFFRSVVKRFAPRVKPRQLLVSATKGLEFPSEKRMTEILAEELPGHENIVALSGPTHAEEVSRDVPTAIVAASLNEEAARAIQEAFSTEFFRVYRNTDVIGVELCAAIKNVVAIAAGMVRGLGFGDNTMAALITRGLAEMRRLGLKKGAQEATFSGLAGAGDLIVTCTSRHSRNGRVGEALAQGKSIEEILASMKMVAEGVETVRPVLKMAGEEGVEVPISQAVYNVIYEHQHPLEVMKQLMLRPLKDETQ
ncbi:NAD(P)H-dependent glycerol-3-phosphate dehydrogenase [Thermospira aquatica]|uniref:Glycerol-3-phosphate dehydrogenase [NAD(P)+] n=1 Tax=Thermospira aquatica TaxID=2828656 RepID=A0AAX3BCH1_9SPIR|nr:NAD(P)H-dependent glycerol-3-phosphate dehydrogenase [Thermospira aquatica]URA10007.1 NAD(P)-dependent glycerol-3-phosphate dehydrogenase [Thermospira aquatica]